MLLSCLKSLHSFGIAILPLITELHNIYPQFKGEFGTLEYKLLDIGISILPAMDEIINILTRLNSEFDFSGVGRIVRNLGVPTIMSGGIRLPTQPNFQHVLQNYDKRTAQYMLGHTSIGTTEDKNMFFLGTQTKIEYKFRIKELNLSEEAAIYSVLREITEEFSMETLNSY